MRPCWIVCTCAAAGLTVAAAILSGCGGGEDSTPVVSPLGSPLQAAGASNETPAAAASTAVPDLAGSWHGLFLDATTGARESISATITQSGGELTIDTSLSGLGGYFSGSIQPEGYLWLTDAWDGETWTTLSGPAVEGYIVIQDYVPNPDDPDEMLLNTIELSR